MEENTIVTNQDENVNNVLNSVSDEYLAKKKKNRKITFSLISFFVLALATVIIVLSCVRVNLKPEFIDNAVRYEITTKGNSTTMVYESTDEGFKEFDKLFDEAFSLSYLTALFSGKLGGYELNASDETNEYYYSDTKNNTGMSTTLKNALGSNYVRVVFDEEKQVKYSNGDVYKSKYNSDYDLKFEELYFNLHDTTEDETLTFYLGTNGYSSGTRITKITVKANTYSLYKFAIND